MLDVFTNDIKIEHNILQVTNDVKIEHNILQVPQKFPTMPMYPEQIFLCVMYCTRGKFHFKGFLKSAN